MSAAVVVVGGAAFIAGFCWREVLINWSALRRIAIPDGSRQRVLPSGYYTWVTGTIVTRGVLGVVVAVMGAALATQLTESGGQGWARLVCVGLLTVFLVLSLSRTWPAARQLVVGTGSRDTQMGGARRLLRYHVAYIAMMAAIVAIQLAMAEEGAASAAIAAGGAGFVAATLWNEVLIDRPAARLEVEPSDSDRSTLVGYYAVMTATLVRPNLATVFLAICATVAALVVQLLGTGTPAWATWTSLAIFAVFLVLAGLRTWPAAVRLGGNSESAEMQMRSGQILGRYHLAFVIMLFAIAGIQLIATV
ncbi:hypothetical protein [Nocardia sp. NPDC052112]|uniref:hypothetical protein n=1 Tax=Nocardia sp. NPDC052112 TaxID=3155646 RepID=UPI0034248FCB